MEAYNKSWKECRELQHRSIETIDSDMIFYKGFFIRKHYGQAIGETRYIVCARFAEGGDKRILDELSKYIGILPPNLVDVILMKQLWLFTPILESS